MQTQMGSTCTPLLLLNFWARYGCTVNTMPQICKYRGCNFRFLSQVQYYLLTVAVQTHQLLNIPTTELSQLHSASKLHEDAMRNPQWSRLYSHKPEGNSNSEHHTTMGCKNNRHNCYNQQHRQWRSRQNKVQGNQLTRSGQHSFTNEKDACMYVHTYIKYKTLKIFYQLI